MAISTPRFATGAAPIQQAFSILRQSEQQEKPFDSIMRTFMELSRNKRMGEQEVSELGPTGDDPITQALLGEDLPFLSGERGFFEQGQ